MPKKQWEDCCENLLLFLFRSWQPFAPVILLHLQSCQILTQDFGTNIAMT